MTAIHAMSSPAMAVASHTSLNNSLPSSTPAASLSSKKQEHLKAGRRRLEEFKQKRRENNKVLSSSNQSTTEATAQALSKSHAGVLSLTVEEVGDLSGNFEGNYGNNMESFDKRELPNGMVLDIKGATISPALLIEQQHTHLWKGSSPQTVSESKNSTQTSEVQDSRLSKGLVTDEDRPSLQPILGGVNKPQSDLKPNIIHVLSDDSHDEVVKNSFLVSNATAGSIPFSASARMVVKQDPPRNSLAGSLRDDGQSLENNGSTRVQSFQAEVTQWQPDPRFDLSLHEKQHDDVQVPAAEGNGSWHEKKGAVQVQDAGLLIHTDNTDLSSRNEFFVPSTQLTDYKVVQEAPSSRGTDGPSSYSSSSLPFTSSRLSNTSLSTSDQHTSITTQHEGSLSPLFQFQRPFKELTVTARNTPFFSATDSLFSQEPAKITDTPLNVVKSDHEVDCEEENIRSLSDLLVLSNALEVDDVRIGDKLSNIGRLEKLRPSLDRSDEFASLEQHIEDLTQEKFALQRGLDAARGLTESLAQENSALTEDFNQQGDLITELKAELEKQQSELLAQTLKLNNLKLERDKAQQESMSAVERSQAFAAEVVSLEERILKVRSQELKLEKEMKELMSENQSQKAQISSMEKDRSNLRSMIEALQEEKKVLQSRLRKAANSNEDVSKGSKVIADKSVRDRITVDVSTSTDDLVLESTSIKDVPTQLDSTSPLTALTQTQSALNGSTSSESNSLPVPCLLSSLPPESVRKVENINILITELAEEKAALLKTLLSESAAAGELRALNAELSRKLEVQTQQLELAVSQRIAHESTPIHRNMYQAPAAGPEFVDEGDEVVERVLGWIMKLFPGGSSRRTGSKHL